MIINFKCSKEQFPAIDMFLNQQEYTDKPDFSMVPFQVDVEGKIYQYNIMQGPNKLYYIVTR